MGHIAFVYLSVKAMKFKHILFCVVRRIEICLLFESIWSEKKNIYLKNAWKENHMWTIYNNYLSKSFIIFFFHGLCNLNFS